MRTESIGTEENWERFMRLTSNARMRNEGFAEGAAVRRTAVAATVQPAFASGAPKAALPSLHAATDDGSYAAAHTAANFRILGGKFDAYA